MIDPGAAGGSSGADEDGLATTPQVFGRRTGAPTGSPDARRSRFRWDAQAQAGLFPEHTVPASSSARFLPEAVLAPAQSGAGPAGSAPAPAKSGSGPASSDRRLPEPPLQAPGGSVAHLAVLLPVGRGCTAMPREPISGHRALPMASRSGPQSRARCLRGSSACTSQAKRSPSIPMTSRKTRRVRWRTSVLAEGQEVRVGLPRRPGRDAVGVDEVLLDLLSGQLDQTEAARHVIPAPLQADGTSMHRPRRGSSQNTRFLPAPARGSYRRRCWLLPRAVLDLRDPLLPPPELVRTRIIRQAPPRQKSGTDCPHAFSASSSSVASM